MDGPRGWQPTSRLQATPVTMIGGGARAGRGKVRADDCSVRTHQGQLRAVSRCFPRTDEDGDESIRTIYGMATLVSLGTTWDDNATTGDGDDVPPSRITRQPEGAYLTAVATRRPRETDAPL